MRFPWGALEVGLTATRSGPGARRLRSGGLVVAMPGSFGPAAAGTDVLLFRGKVLGPRAQPTSRHPPSEPNSARPSVHVGRTQRRGSSSSRVCCPAWPALRESRRSRHRLTAPEPCELRASSRMGAGKLRPRLLGWSCASRNIAASSLGSPDAVPQLLKLPSCIISTPCTKAPNLEGKSGNVLSSEAALLSSEPGRKRI